MTSTIDAARVRAMPHGPHRRRVRLVLLAFVLAGLFAFSACSDGVTPELSGLTYKGQAPDSSVVLLFEMNFVDPDGDLGDGFIEVFIDGQPSSLGLLNLAPIFVRNDLDVDATSGTLKMPLELAIDDASLPPSGTTFSVGFRATDGSDHTSREATVFLQLTH